MFVLKKIREYASNPERVALIDRDRRMTYAELDARSEAFAAWLIDHAASDRSVVICGDKEMDFLPCLFGALKSGRAYVPIDSVVPGDRAAQILEDVVPSAVVDFTGRLSAGDVPLLHQKDLDTLLAAPSAPVPEDRWASDEDTVYILFTSGSTGRPKGVSITVENLTAFARGILHWYPEEGGVILHQISYSFDVSGCAVYAGLSRGMTLFTVDHAMVADFPELFRQLAASGLTFWASTPSFAELCVQSRAFDAAMLPELKRFLFCGEVLTHTLCDALAERFPKADVINTYGPTEATVLVTAVSVTKSMRGDALPIPIGAPIDGVTLRLEDETGAEADEGELVILGGSVGPGYLGRPDLTAKSFFTDAATGLRGYRTGDLCYRRNGLYYYQGRVDNQLKLDGYRIELEDVETNLQKLSNVLRAAVVPQKDGEKITALTAFLLLKEPDGLTPLKRTVALKQEAARYLPGYMIPRRFIVVDAFPLNVNGKIDRKALAARLEAGR